MRTPPLLADFIHHRVCKPICEKLLTLPGIEPNKERENKENQGGLRAVLSSLPHGLPHKKKDCRIPTIFLSVNVFISS